MERAFKIARADRYTLIGAKAPRSALHGDFPVDSDGLAALDIHIESGRIAALAPAGSRPIDDAVPRLALDGGIVLPLLVDAHTHLDKGHIWPRAPNADGSFANALATVKADRERCWSAADIAKRMDSRCAAPTRMGQALSAPISTASGRRSRFLGRFSPKRASAGAAGSSCK